jgi:hypothetical protein
MYHTEPEYFLYCGKQYNKLDFGYKSRRIFFKTKKDYIDFEIKPLGNTNNWSEWCSAIIGTKDNYVKVINNGNELGTFGRDFPILPILPHTEYQFRGENNKIPIMICRIYNDGKVNDFLKQYEDFIDEKHGLCFISGRVKKQTKRNILLSKMIRNMDVPQIKLNLFQ